VEYLVLVDTTVLLETADGIQVVTDDRLAHVATVKHDAMHQQPTGSAAHRQRWR
jgi:hypothetical protein